MVKKNISQLLGLTKYGDSYKNLGGEETKIYSATANLMNRLGYSLGKVSGRIEKIFSKYGNISIDVEDPKRIIHAVNESLSPDYFVKEGVSPLNWGIAIAHLGANSGSDIEAIATFGEKGNEGDFIGIDSQGQRIDSPIIMINHFLQPNQK